MKYVGNINLKINLLMAPTFGLGKTTSLKNPKKKYGREEQNATDSVTTGIFSLFKSVIFC